MSETKVYLCFVCDKAMSADSIFVGYTDSRGQHFAHKRCYDVALRLQPKEWLPKITLEGNHLPRSEPGELPPTPPPTTQGPPDQKPPPPPPSEERICAVCGKPLSPGESIMIWEHGGRQFFAHLADNCARSEEKREGRCPACRGILHLGITTHEPDCPVFLAKKEILLGTPSTKAAGDPGLYVDGPALPSIKVDPYRKECSQVPVMTEERFVSAVKFFLLRDSVQLGEPRMLRATEDDLRKAYHEHCALFTHEETPQPLPCRAVHLICTSRDGDVCNASQATQDVCINRQRQFHEKYVEQIAVRSELKRERDELKAKVVELESSVQVHWHRWNDADKEHRAAQKRIAKLEADAQHDAICKAELRTCIEELNALLNKANPVIVRDIQACMDAHNHKDVECAVTSCRECDYRLRKYPMTNRLGVPLLIRKKKGGKK